MTKKELKKEANQKSTEWFQANVSHDTWETPYTERYIFELGYLASAEPRENRIVELENKLSEAKEILMKIAKSFDDMYLMNALSQAKQFLAEQFLEEVKE